ncbi:S1/P1 nuclease [Bradyrhizobium daqingense]|uniref:S1/P1 nuclease n=1 Tax=Bradyrhizobium daqingense TaxID=993502 RepID=A0A562KF45_9BRAD|nr:S1/P1 nuclease [Bradyrhizobium daqingense]TWH94030.1 S1/P1 nuclease [Bradyrhizobium daqingense]UFS90323.1 S1/P1 nuclease [Bradyrhizobium daqingense]
MRANLPKVALALVMTCCATSAFAWWDGGHMQIAYVAYKKLDAPVKEKVDALLKLNKDYAKWTASAPDERTAKRNAFVHAATWADDIKTKEYNYTRDKVDGPAAGQNIGYSDRNQHAYWHYKDINYSPDGTPLPAPDAIDLVTQLKLMIAALPPSSGATDDVRSYDLVWILHLVGDAHQPLHGIARYTRQIPNGDAGGNTEQVIPANGDVMALHAYWDSLFCGYISVAGAVFDADERDGLAGAAVSEAMAQISDPQAWIEESAELAKQYAYAAPVSLGANPVLLTRDYETNARNIARSQAALAAARLARLLNDALK